MIILEKLKKTPTGREKVEVVERKGLGHPDYIADSIAENFSRKLCKLYLEKFGTILHHNVDKLQVVGGETKPKFGGGEVLKKILIFFSGRATNQVGKEKINVEEIAISSAKEFIQKNFRFLDPEEHVVYLVETKSGAGNLVDIYRRKKGIIGANDTSVGLGYYPPTKLEEVVFHLERFLNSEKFKSEFPFSGEDVKVLGWRMKEKFHFTIAMSFVDKFVESVEDYKRKKKEVIAEVEEYLKGRLSNKFEVWLNTADNEKRGIDGCYLTVTGTSAEHGDDGANGRGNRVNGVIPFNRPISLECVSGKNPVNHVGKVYNVLAYEIAKAIYEKTSVDEVYVRLVSQIGKRIDKPALIHLQLLGKVKIGEVRGLVKEIIAEWLSKEKLLQIRNQIIEGKLSLF